ncbi:MAG TPA: hypothetical protein VKM56_07190 [Verrucomicrobiae bacterium]|nr:hypothetical protein [Verrucomicrobiae bacterium]
MIRFGYEPGEFQNGTHHSLYAGGLDRPSRENFSNQFLWERPFSGDAVLYLKGKSSGGHSQ